MPSDAETLRAWVAALRVVPTYQRLSSASSQHRALAALDVLVEAGSVIQNGDAGLHAASACQRVASDALRRACQLIEPPVEGSSSRKVEHGEGATDV